MRRKSTTPRSFLRQLAEPIPRTAAPLIPRRPAAERGTATRSSLDAIPQIIDVTETRNTGASEPQHAQQASSIAKRVPKPRTKMSARSEGSEVNTTTNTPAIHARHAKQSSANAAGKILQSSMHEHIGTENETLPRATQEDPHLQSVLAHSVSAQTTSPLSPTPPQTTAKTERRPEIKVHIGTIEVRVPAPPMRNAQPARPALNPRNSQLAIPSRASEPLSRSLAWSHGLVQG
jgi:hypothetical protein